MKKVLVLAYYFPPFGLSGVQRVLKFVKYLPDFGWQPTVVTTEPHAYPAFDESLMEELRQSGTEVWRTGAAGAFAVVNKARTIPLSTERVRKLLNRASQLVYVPDNKIGWKNKVLELLQEKDVSQFHAVLSTAPPFSAHRAGLEIKRRYGLPFLADFRDSWVGNPWHVYWTPLHRMLHERMERNVMYGADALITTNSFTRDTWHQRYNDDSLLQRMHVVEQGYDPDDFGETFATPANSNSNELRVVYTGLFYEERHPLPLYEVLYALKQRFPDVYRAVKFSLVGYVQEEYRAVAQRLGVEDRFEYVGYVEHNESVAWLAKANVLWMTMGEGGTRYATVSPGKTFEYLGSRRPIFAMAGECYTKAVLERFSHTFIVAPSNIDAGVDALVRLVELQRQGALPHATAEEVQPYSRKHLTGELSRILNQCTQ